MLLVGERRSRLLCKVGEGLSTDVDDDALDRAAHELPRRFRRRTKLASSWVRDEKLETAFPNPPKITSGTIVAQSNGVAVA